MKKLISILIIFSLIFSACACASKDEEADIAKPEIEVVDTPSRAELIASDEINDEYIEITNAAELCAIPDGSAKNFYLSCDIDMNGKAWMPKDFSGSFDGKGFTISNLSISGHSNGIESTYDGNMKVYDTCFAGMFGILDGAKVENLTLKNLSFKCATGSANIFAGSVAGFMNNALISNVKVNGKGYLETSSKCFGIGGIAGYGNGEIRDSEADMVLVCIDNNAAEKDEQFMGGAYAAGCINLNNNKIKIDGYDSDHGYVHNGGLVGMYIHYYDNVPTGSICNNNVTGRIKFFEDNRDRRAYCSAYVGEMMNWDLAMNGNSESFTRDEVFEYNVNLLPE